MPSSDSSSKMFRAVLSSVAIVCCLWPVVVVPQDSEQLLQQATEAAQRGEHERSIRLLTRAIDGDAKLAIAWYLRGRENFKAGKIDESVADFDQYVQLDPAAENRQWERGISYYYAGQFAKGAKQFEDYQKFHDQDVENSVWRYLCVARASGVEKARAT